MSNTLMTFAVVMALALGMTACEDETPSQKTSDAGRSAGQAANDVTKATDGHLPRSKDAAVPETLNGIERKTMSIFAVVAAVAVLSTVVLGAPPETKEASSEQKAHMAVMNAPLHPSSPEMPPGQTDTLDRTMTKK